MTKSARALVGACLLVVAGSARCEDPRSKAPDDASALVGEACRSPDFSGSVLASSGSGAVTFRACGSADRSRQTPIDRRTRFKAYSISKSITALTILRLEGLGRLHVSDGIGAHIDGLPHGWRSVTIEQLLQHTSGLPDLTEELAGLLLADRTLTWRDAVWRVLASHAKDSLPAAPGSTWRYNNFGYELLARIAEQASGQDFPAAVRRLVFAPAGMRTAYISTRQNGVEGPSDRLLARGYECPTDGGGETVSHSFVQMGAGAAVVAPDDLLALARAVQSGRLIPRERLRAMIDTTFKATGGSPYGEGFLVRSADGRPYLQHSGGNNGYVSEWGFDPFGRSAVVVMTNISCAPASELRSKLMEVEMSAASSDAAAPRASKRQAAS